MTSVTCCDDVLQKNALKAICPATVDVLLRTLSRQPLPDTVTSSDGQQQERDRGQGRGQERGQRAQDSLALKELVLRCLVKTVHVLHNSPSDQVSGARAAQQSQ